jgi:phenylalanyl-tRNA synthetase alpha chain
MYKGEDKVLEILSKEKELTIKELASRAGMNEDSVRRIVESLKSTGHVNTEISETFTGTPTEEFDNYYQTTFPEFSVFEKALKGASVSDLSPAERSIGLRWAKVKGLVNIEEGKLIATKSSEDAEARINKLKKAYEQIKETGIADRVILDELFKRHLLEKKSKKEVQVTYTGKKKMEEGFNVNVPAADAPLGKSHPITKITNKMKSIMTELGFQEMEGGIIESSFWNFDALFQPQDHPARELADTFYLDHESPLPKDKSLVNRVKKAHEGGWKYQWDPKEGSKSVLRTHTTCLSARYLSEIKDKKPRKFFAIGRVFRNEATDYSHLAEFHQVEGIIAWENAKFTDLLGILKEFYRKLGFEKIRFRPSFFPYTEPSLEIEVYFEKKKQWLELGGAGIFRPEVSIPLAGIYPVLAWGLSLERPLMLALELEDIRTFYKNDQDFLISSRLDI